MAKSKIVRSSEEPDRRASMRHEPYGAPADGSAGKDEAAKRHGLRTALRARQSVLACALGL